MTHRRIVPRRRLASRHPIVTALCAVAVVTTLGTALAVGTAAALPAPATLAPAAVMSLLDTRAALGLPAEVADFGLDDSIGQVVVSLAGQRTAAVDALLAGIDPALVAVRTNAPAPHHQSALRGGDTIINGSVRCTVGFVAQGSGHDWLLTAGHCIHGSGTWYGQSGGDWVPIGDGAKAAANGTDVAEIPVDNSTDWQSRGAVGGVTVTGSTPAAVGSPVCLYGSTSGRVCGTITGRNRTVNFDGVVQSGMTATSICSRDGDSGGPYITASGQAQGIHSGGGTSGSCVSYFSPVSTALSAFGLSLRTG